MRIGGAMHKIITTTGIKPVKLHHLSCRGLINQTRWEQIPCFLLPSDIKFHPWWLLSLQLKNNNISPLENLFYFMYHSFHRNPFWNCTVNWGHRYSVDLIKWACRLVECQYAGSLALKNGYRLGHLWKDLDENTDYEMPPENFQISEIQAVTLDIACNTKHG